MKNLIMQSGRNITLTAAAAVLSGTGVLIGSLFGVASSNAAIGEPLVLDTGGVYGLTKAAGQAFAVGAKVYFDPVAKNVTTVAAANTLIGVAIKAAAGGDATAQVRLGIVP